MSYPQFRRDIPPILILAWLAIFESSIYDWQDRSGNISFWNNQSIDSRKKRLSLWMNASLSIWFSKSISTTS